MVLNFSSMQWDNLFSLLSEGASKSLLVNALAFQMIIDEQELVSPTQEQLADPEFTDAELTARKELALEDQDDIVSSVIVNIDNVNYMDLAGNIWLDVVGRYKISLAELHFSIVSDEIKNIDMLITDNNPAEITHYYRKNGMLGLDDFIKGKDGILLSDGKSIVDYDAKTRKAKVEFQSSNEISDELVDYVERLEMALENAINDVYVKQTISNELTR